MGVANSIIPGSAIAVLEMVVGKEKGKTYELLADRLSVGRSENNDIVLASESVSRYHAVIERGGEGVYTIRDNGSKNGVVLNGKPVNEAELRDGDVVQIGAFAFRFTGALDVPGEASPSPMATAGDEAAPEEFYPQAMPGVSKRSAGPPSRRPLIYGVLVVVLGGAYYISQQDEKPKESTTAADGAVPGASSPAQPPTLAKGPAGSKVAGLEDPTLSAVEQRLDKMELGNTAVREAETSFKKGLREFENKNYLRAMEDFRSAASLYRGHPLADYYYRLSVYEVEIEAKKNYEYGRKYFESMQFSRAIFHFNTVISLMEHRPTDPMVASSQKYILISKKQLQAAEQYP
jgi:pSer/pThr/pTyr-binding forkhead associated (FHA) protein